jgi:hypothetical protein
VNVNETDMMARGLTTVVAIAGDLNFVKWILLHLCV